MGKKGDKSAKDHSESSGDESDSDFNVKKYREMLQKIFPSNYMKDKVKKDKESEVKNKKKGKKGKSKGSESPSKKLKSPAKAKSSKKSKKPKVKKHVTSSDSNSNSESDRSDMSVESDSGGEKKFNIVFTIGGGQKGMRDTIEDSDEWNTDDMDDYDSDTSFFSEEYDTSDESYRPDSMSTTDNSDPSEEENEGRRRKSKRLARKSSEKKDSLEEDDEEECGSESDLKLVTQYKNVVTELAEKHKSSKLLKSLIKDANERERKMSKGIKKKEKKQRVKNTKEFRGLAKERNPMNDIRYFRDELSVDQQKTILKEVKEVTDIMKVEKPYRLKVLEANIPQTFKACALKKVNLLRYMSPGEGEYYKLKSWVDAFMRIPFEQYSSLPITLQDGVEKCHTFMKEAQEELDKAVHGLNDAKMQILQMVGQWIVNPQAVGTAIAIKGPMGTGKTTLVKDGISKILGRKFAFIALGGATDSSFLEGHSYTYEGSTWGKIVDILLQCKTMNPVIYFDELDKISDTPRGEEIAGILTHLTDVAQNNQYHDKYFSEIDFDLSKCLFIFSYNDESKVNPILKDRMYKISTKGYKKDEKVEIANNYLLPKIREQCSFSAEDIVIPKDTIEYIIDLYTGGEEGVRNLKRCLEIIHTKLNLFRLMKEGTNLFEGQIALKVTFPYTLERDICEKLLKKEEIDAPPEGMYI